METPMRSNFFKAPLIAEYKKLLKPILTEKKLTIFNLEELLQYLQKTSLDIYEFRKSAARELRKEQEREQNIASIIRDLSTSMCPNIGISYGRRAIERTITAVESPDSQSESPGAPTRFDILVLINADYETLNPKSKKSLMNQRLDHIRGFLVTELAECKSQPEVHSVNLICSNLPGGGAFLMGAYLYCIKRTRSLPQLGLLELGGGFENTKGLCAYSKFGYLPNLTYLGPHCFTDSGNLPMSVDVSQLTADQILEVVRGTAKVRQFDLAAKETTIFDILNTHPLCNFGLFESENEQEKIARTYSHLYRLMYQVRTLTGYSADANDIPAHVMNIIKPELTNKIDYYEKKKEKTDKYLSEDEKTAVVRDVVTAKINSKIAELTDLVNEVQDTKRMLLDRKIGKLRQQYDASGDPTKKRELMISIKDLEVQKAAINRFSGEATPSPESVQSAATTVTEVSARSPSVMSTLSEEERRAETAHFYRSSSSRKSKAKSMYSKKKSAKKAARKSAKKLVAKQKTAKKKTARLSMPPKVPRTMPKAPWIPASPKSMGL